MSNGESSANESSELEYHSLAFEECLDHEGFQVNMYCENCKISTCSKCNKVSHEKHNIVCLEKKMVDTKEDLESFQTKCRKQLKEAKKKEAKLDHRVKYIQRTASEAIDEMTKQYEHVQNELQIAYSKEIESVRRLKSEQLTTIDEEKADFKTYIDSCGNIGKQGKQLLDQTMSLNFISNVDDFLSNNHLEDVPEALGTNVRIIQYMPPLCMLHADSKSFHAYLEKHVLGYFSPYRRKGIAHPQRSPYRMGPLVENIRSLESLSEDSCVTEVTGFDIDEDKSELGQNFQPPDTTVIAEMMFHINIRQFRASHLKTFSNALFDGERMWICGWNMNVTEQKDMVLFNVQGPEYRVLSKHKKLDQKAELPLITCPFKNSLLFAKRGDREVHMFQTTSKKFKLLMRGKDSAITAMCANDNYVYICDTKLPDQIRIFDASFRDLSTIPMGIGYKKPRDIDICSINNPDQVEPSDLKPENHHLALDHIIVISIPYPHGCIKAISSRAGDLWQLDCHNHPDLPGPLFNPCSVAASEAGDIYIADRGTNRVCNFDYLRHFVLFIR